MFDIIIIGGGPAGAIAAKILAKADKKVLLIEKDLSFKKPCGGGIRLDAFAEFGIDKKLIRSYINEIVLETKRKTVAFDISRTPLGVVERCEFDAQLRDDAKRAGTELLEAKTIDVKVQEASVIVTAKTKDQSMDFEAAYIIAADGVLSGIRKKMGHGSVPCGLTHYSDVTTLKTDKCHFYFDSNLAGRFYGWRFPYQGGSDIGTASFKNGERTYIHNLFKYLGITERQKVKGYNIPVWEDPLFYDKRIFYVGDSAGQVLPFTYEGIYYAMKSAKILAETLIEGEDPSAYEKRWNKTFLKKFKTLKKLETIFLYNNFMIYLMIKTVGHPKVKPKVLDLWMDRSEIDVNFSFFIRVFKRLFTR